MKPLLLLLTGFALIALAIVLTDRWAGVAHAAFHGAVSPVQWPSLVTVIALSGASLWLLGIALAFNLE